LSAFFFWILRILRFYGTCSFIYYTFAQDVSVFAQKYQAALKKVFLRSESSSYAQNKATYAQKPFCLSFLSMIKGFILLTKEKTDPTEVVSPSIESVSSFFRLILFRTNGHQRRQDLERCIRGRLTSHLMQPRKYLHQGARPGSLLRLLEQQLST
jgi:hypothetical protein